MGFDEGLPIKILDRDLEHDYSECCKVSEIDNRNSGLEDYGEEVVTLPRGHEDPLEFIKYCESHSISKEPLFSEDEIRFLFFLNNIPKDRKIDYESTLSSSSEKKYYLPVNIMRPLLSKIKYFR